MCTCTRTCNDSRENVRPEKAKKSNFRRRTIGWNLHLEIYGSHVEEEDQKCTKSCGAPPPWGGCRGWGGGGSGSQQHLLPLMTCCRTAFGEILLERCNQVGLKASEVLNLIRQLEASDGSNLSPRRPENHCFDPNPCVFREFWGVYRHNLTPLFRCSHAAMLV